MATVLRTRGQISVPRWIVIRRDQVFEDVNQNFGSDSLRLDHPRILPMAVADKPRSRGACLLLATASEAL